MVDLSWAQAPAAGALFGFISGQLAVWLDRWRQNRARAPRWEFLHVRKSAWRLVNVGDGDAFAVRVRLENALYAAGTISAEPSDEFEVGELRRGESREFLVYNRARDATGVVTWTDRRGREHVSNRVFVPPRSE